MRPPARRPTLPPVPPPAGFERRQWQEACGEATALLQRLLRIDTTNPPGNESAAARVMGQVLAEDEIRFEILEAAPGRANVVCRLGAPGGETEPPLLLAGHLDVAPPGDLDRWSHPPFSGELVDGMIWGRGAIDMKNMVAMSAMVMKLLRRRGTPLRRDLIFAAVADEEEGCVHGSKFLVEQHPDKVRAGYALGEVGGFPFVAGKARVLLVQTAEKGICWLRARTSGTQGHGSIPCRDNPVVRLSRALATIGARSLPQHNTPVMESFIRTVSALQPLPERLVLPRLLNPRLSGVILDKLYPDQAAAAKIRALLHNTAVPTVVHAGEKTNVVPETAEALIDGRTLPGQSADDLLRELRDLVGDTVTFEVIRQAPGATNHPADSPLWDCIRSVIRSRDGGLPVVPNMIPGFTDGRYFSQLGARWYGFAPTWLDPLTAGVSVGDLYHAVDERIPEDGFHWGLQVLYEVVDAFCARGPAGR